VLLARLGPTPFVDALGSTSVASLVLASGITALTTLVAAWRWRQVSAALGLDLPLGSAIAAYYRSQLLNCTLPGGVVGDVHRGVRHGRDAGTLGGGLRAVAWERTLGQGVQVVVTGLVLLVLPTPFHAELPVGGPLAVAALAVAAVAAVLVRRRRRPRGRGALSRTASAVAADLRDILRAPRAFTGILLASLVVVTGHTAVFLLAARATGVSVSPGTLVPVALVVLLVSAVPASIAGWGPREGAAAWAFAAVGLSASQGLSTAVVYGVMALVATLPGAVVLVASRPRPTRNATRRHTTAEPMEARRA
jgi:uncharacterized membrane protein YbhN (UPF0104 family)